MVSTRLAGNDGYDFVKVNCHGSQARFPASTQYILQISVCLGVKNHFKLIGSRRATGLEFVSFSYKPW